MNRILGISILFSIIVISGISLADAIECNDYQRDDGKIICLSQSTAEKLMERGWNLESITSTITLPIINEKNEINSAITQTDIVNEPIVISDKTITTGSFNSNDVNGELGPPDSILIEIGQFLRDHPPIESIEEIINEQRWNATTIERFFELNPDIENQPPNYIINPENISELIPQDITFPSVIDMPINDTAAMAKKIMEWTGDKDIVNIRESDTRISYETSSFGKVSFNKVLDYPTEIHITLLYPYQIKQENSEQASRDLMEYLGMDTKYISEHRPREYTNDVKQSFFQKKDGLFVDSNSFYGNFYGGSTDFYINKWNHNLDEMNLIDVEIAKETAQNYVMDNDENLNTTCKDNIFKTDRGAAIVMLEDRPIYKVETDGCEMHSSPSQIYYAYVDAITGKPLFVKTYRSF